MTFYLSSAPHASREQRQGMLQLVSHWPLGEKNKGELRLERREHSCKLRTIQDP